MELRKIFIVLFLLAGFFVSRLYILNHPPFIEGNSLTYSDVKHDYERYANMWNLGLTPYKIHLFEYPPATLSLLWLPLLVAEHGWGSYYPNYRIVIFLFDLLLFIFILKTLKKLPGRVFSKLLSLIFYFIAPMIAKDFFYDGIDLAFSGSLTIGLILLFLNSNENFVKRVIFWFFIWLSTAIKFMSLPLVVPFFYLKRLAFKKELLAGLMGFLLVWGIPLAIFRSSLSVSFLFHARRPLKYASFPSYIVESINQFTQTEIRVMEAPDFQLVGPVSEKVTTIFQVIFPLSVGLILLYFLLKITKSSLKTPSDFIAKIAFLKTHSSVHLDRFVFGVKISLIFFYTLFLSGKIFSQPFHIWPIPLIAIFPFSNLKHQLTFILMTLWLLVVDTTPWIRVDESQIIISKFNMKFFIYTLRFLPMMVLLWLSFKLPNKIAEKR